MFLVSEVTLQCREIHQMHKLGQAVMALFFRLETDRTACLVHATMPRRSFTCRSFRFFEHPA